MFLCRHSTRKRGLKEPRSVRLNYIRNLPYIISEKYPRDTLIRIFFAVWMRKILDNFSIFHRLGNFLERNASQSCFQDFVFLWVPVVFHTQIYLRTHNLSIQIVCYTAFLQKKRPHPYNPRLREPELYEYGHWQNCLSTMSEDNIQKNYPLIHLSKNAICSAVWNQRSPPSITVNATSFRTGKAVNARFPSVRHSSRRYSFAKVRILS